MTNSQRRDLLAIKAIAAADKAGRCTRPGARKWWLAKATQYMNEAMKEGK